MREARLHLLSCFTTGLPVATLEVRSGPFEDWVTECAGPRRWVLDQVAAMGLTVVETIDVEQDTEDYDG